MCIRDRDIARDPRWGRIIEGFGEDPYLASQFAAASVKGFQRQAGAGSPGMAACAKHFIGYGAVSYTHLDVYKRQGRYCRLCISES